MARYMISYDLHSPTSNRDSVETAIKSLGAYCKYLTTTYLVKTSYSISSVQDICTKPLDSNDKMIICEITGTVHGWLSQENWDWINTNMS